MAERLMDSCVWATSVTVLIMERFFKIKIGVVRRGKINFHTHPQKGETFVLVRLEDAHYEPLYRKKEGRKIVFFTK